MTEPATIGHAVQQTRDRLEALHEAGGHACGTEAYAILHAVWPAQ